MNSLKDKEEDIQFKKFGCSEKNLTNLMSADIQLPNYFKIYKHYFNMYKDIKYKRL